MISLHKCSGNCNTFNDIHDKMRVPNKTEDVNLSVFSLITSKIESRLSKKNIYHANVKVNLTVKNVIQIKFRIMINVNESAKI